MVLKIYFAGHRSSCSVEDKDKVVILPCRYMLSPSNQLHRERAAICPRSARMSSSARISVNKQVLLLRFSACGGDRRTSALFISGATIVSFETPTNADTVLLSLHAVAGVARA